MQQESIYAQAVELAKSRRAIDIKYAVELFESLCGYKDAASQAEACKQRLEQLARCREHHGLVVKCNQKSGVTALGVVVCLLVLCLAVGILAVATLSKQNNQQALQIYAEEPLANLTENSVNTAFPRSTATPTFDLPSQSQTGGITPNPYGTIAGTSTPTGILSPTRTSTPQPTTVPSVSTTLSSNVAIGSIVRYGAYEQDNILSNGAEAIEWIVIDKQDGKALLLSRCGLDAIPFHERLATVDWSTCTLRTWLNTTFYDQAFNAEQKKKIQTTVITETLATQFDYFPEIEATYDQLFVLSYNEYVQYDAVVDITKCVVTAYAEAQGAFCMAGNIPAPPGWWLRTPYERDGQMMLIDNFGNEEGFATVHSEFHSVRPAMWVQLENDSSPTAAPTIPEKTPTPTATPIPSTVSVGDCITFGVYEQDGNFANGKEDIEWLVLDKQDGKALVISLYGLDCQPFNKTNQSVTWEDCTLRNWLNTTFYTTAFTDSQQKYIASTTLLNRANPNVLNGVDRANTTDKVFLLSVDEAKQYIKRNIDERLLRMPITAYTKSLGSAWGDTYGDASMNHWLLRTSGYSENQVSYVEYGKDIYLSGTWVWDNNYVIRPAMWVSLAN